MDPRKRPASLPVAEEAAPSETPHAVSCVYGVKLVLRVTPENVE
jgi:hypothetical protein